MHIDPATAIDWLRTAVTRARAASACSRVQNHFQCQTGPAAAAGREAERGGRAAI
jgi:hypothetical protein